MCGHNRNYDYRRRRFQGTEEDPSRKIAREKIKFYRNLRAFMIFNSVMFLLFIMGSGAFGMYKVTIVWGFFLALHYFKVFGMPGSGWLGQDWEEWMYERERRRYQQGGDTVVDIDKKDEGPWTERDLV